jgi:hypothetical protein
MGFANALSVLRPTLPYYVALTKYGLLRITKDSFQFDPNPAAPPVALEMARAAFTMGASSCTESYAMSRTLAEGPKVFAFDALTCEALENFDLSVPTADYLQPFPSVVIELPADYTKKRVVSFEEDSHAPDFVVVRHEPEAGCVLLAMHLTSHQVLTRLLKLDPAWTLEEMWEKGQRAWDARDTLGMTPEEAALGSALSKLALNVCLMATAYGVRCLGPANPSHYERLNRYAKLARKRGREQQERAEMEVRMTPLGEEVYRHDGIPLPLQAQGPAAASPGRGRSGRRRPAPGVPSGGRRPRRGGQPGAQPLRAGAHRTGPADAGGTARPGGRGGAGDRGAAPGAAGGAAAVVPAVVRPRPGQRPAGAFGHRHRGTVSGGASGP